MMIMYTRTPVRFIAEVGEKSTYDCFNTIFSPCLQASPQCILHTLGWIMAKIQSSRIVGLKIREFRRNAGITQEALAEILDVTPQQVQKYESGANKLNTDRLQQVAQALKVPVQAFFMASDSLTPLAESEQLLLTAYRNIPTRETQDALIKLALAATQQIEPA